MKKIVISSLVVLAFVAYVLRSRFGGDQTATPTSNAAATNVVLGTPPVTYKDGTYTGSVADAFYGNIQVKAIITGAKITDVQFLQYPSDRSNSVRINTVAMPLLRQEALQVQTANVQTITGATASSGAFVQSLQSALSQAQV